MSETVDTTSRSAFETPAGSGSGSHAEAEILVVNRDPEIRLLLQKALFVGNFSSTTVATT